MLLLMRDTQEQLWITFCRNMRHNAAAMRSTALGIARADMTEAAPDA